MTPATPQTSRRDALWLLVLAVGLPLLAMLLRGADASWDLRNYHLYNVHAWLHGRSQDVAPAMLQSWHNPLLDLPMYLLFTSGLPMRVTSLWLTLPTMLSIACLLGLQRALSPEAPSRTSQAVLALLALTGAAVYSTLALSSNDAFVGAALLLSLWLVFATPQPDAKRWLLAGLVAGAMAGLKLTASFYCVALACAALSFDGWRANATRLSSLALGGVAGVALTFGWWGLRNARATGNPFFPYYNQVFKSPLLAPEAFTDDRFKPATIVDMLLVPARLLARTTRFAELPLSDPRLLLGFVGLLALAWMYRRSDVGSRLRRLLVFFVVAFGLWAMQYGIYRYAIVLELLGSLVLVLLLARVKRWQPLLLVLALLLVSADTKRPNWGRMRGMSAGAAMQPANLPPGTLVVSAEGEPIAYTALALPDDTVFLGLGTNIVLAGECNGLRQLADLRLQHAGLVWLVGVRPLEQASEARKLLHEGYGLVQDGECRAYPNELAPAWFCPLKFEPVRPVCINRIQHSGGNR